jgi:RNA polymerase sigma factor (sigma-70 family)
VNLDDIDPVQDARDNHLIALDDALSNLEQLDARKAKIVKMRFFVGMKHDEIASALGVSVSTVENEWAYARSWLQVNISGSETDRT